ncbi:MAG: hypothetical protein KBE09_01080 [Candidatus Pacebacteria bacterium]|nr:hypothetical protein [Candidatus Paceibacterota bacterium]
MMRALLVTTLVSFALSTHCTSTATAADGVIVEKGNQTKADHPKGKTCPKTGKPL